VCGAIPPLPNTPSERGAKLKHRDNCTFTDLENKCHENPSNNTNIQTEVHILVTKTSTSFTFLTPFLSLLF
jgi:hypothetical protein